MKRGIYLALLGAVVLGALIVATSGAQVYPVRWYEDEPEPEGSTPPLLVLADGHLQFPDGTVQKTAPGSGESLGATPSPSLVVAEGGVEFPDGTVQTTAAGSLVPRTGQTLCYDVSGDVIDCATDIGPGQDGDLQRGAPWPNPRFTVNGDGTVTDNLTGLIWLANANCTDTVGGINKNIQWLPYARGNLLWADALTWTNALAAGNCGLTDGSAAGAWRLPNVRELSSLVHYGVIVPAVPNTAGTGKCQTCEFADGSPFHDLEIFALYWSSTAQAPWTYQSSRLSVSMGGGGIEVIDIRFGSGGGSFPPRWYVWPVRGGQ